MKLKIVVCLVFALMAFAGFSQDGVKPYVRVSGGGVFLNDADISGRTGLDDAEFDNGYVLGAAVGLATDVEDPETMIPIRAEVEFSYQKNDLDQLNPSSGFVLVGSESGDVSIMTLMVNGYVDFKNESIVTPYLMAGVGAARVDMKLKVGAVSGDDDDTVAAFQAGAGLAFAVSKNVSIDTEYRYFLTDNPDIDGAEVEISGHRLQMGVRYTF